MFDFVYRWLNTDSKVWKSSSADSFFPKHLRFGSFYSNVSKPSQILYQVPPPFRSGGWKHCSWGAPRCVQERIDRPSVGVGCWAALGHKCMLPYFRVRMHRVCKRNPTIRILYAFDGIFRVFKLVARYSKYDFWIPGEILGLHSSLKFKNVKILTTKSKN